MLGLLFTTRQHFIGIEYTTAGGGKAGLLIQAHKDNYRAVLMALRGATHAPITVAEADRKFIASAIGDAGVRTAPAPPSAAAPAPTRRPARRLPLLLRWLPPPPKRLPRLRLPRNPPPDHPADSPPAPQPAPGPVEKGIIHLASTPTGAGIFVNGRFVGQTPAKLRLAPGPHTIRLSLEGFKDWSQELEVLEGSEVTLQIDLTK